MSSQNPVHKHVHTYYWEKMLWCVWCFLWWRVWLSLADDFIWYLIKETENSGLSSNSGLNGRGCARLWHGNPKDVQGLFINMIVVLGDSLDHRWKMVSTSMPTLIGSGSLGIALKNLRLSWKEYGDWLAVSLRAPETGRFHRSVSMDQAVSETVFPLQTSGTWFLFLFFLPRVQALRGFYSWPHEEKGVRGLWRSIYWSYWRRSGIVTVV